MNKTITIHDWTVFGKSFIISYNNWIISKNKGRSYVFHVNKELPNVRYKDNFRIFWNNAIHTLPKCITLW